MARHQAHKQAGVIVRIVGIATALVVGIGMMMAVVAARAQDRYDPDQRWIRSTLREQHREEWRAERREQIASDWRWQERQRDRQRSEWRDRDRERNRDRYAMSIVDDRGRDLSGPRVYGFVARMTQQDRRDCHQGCCPPVENISSAHSNENAAWNHAQLGWMKAVSVRFGSMYADVQNADARTLVRQCFRCEFDESWIGRNREALAQNTGTGNGFKTCCRIIASACIQPIQGAHETPLKGDQPR